MNLPIILGPTGVGKTAIAIEVAAKIGAEICSCDSRQVYQKMDIGTNKPTKQEIAHVKHWLIDIVPPNTTLNAFKYAKLARDKIKDIWSRENMAIVVAGSGLYLRALIEGFFTIPYYNKEIRKKLQPEPSSTLYKKLTELDPATANKLHPNDKMRIIRAIEVYELTGIHMSVLKTTRVPFDCSPMYIGLNMERNALYERIDQRVDKMIDNGLLDEVNRLIQIYGMETSTSAGEKATNSIYFSQFNALQTIGYKELVSYIHNEITLDEAIRSIKRNTRRYAKRQLTWFKSIQGVHWMELPDPLIVDKCIGLIMEGSSCS